MLNYFKFRTNKYLVHIPLHGPLARFVKLLVAHAPGMPGPFSPPPQVSEPDMHHDPCVTNVPWCMPGSLTSGFSRSLWRKKRSRHSRYMCRLIARSREVSKSQNSGLHFTNRSEIWQAHRRQHRCRDAYQIPERCNHYNTQSRGFDISRDLVVRHLIEALAIFESDRITLKSYLSPSRI